MKSRAARRPRAVDASPDRPQGCYACTRAKPVGVIFRSRSSEVPSPARQHHRVAVRILQPDLAVLRIRIDLRTFEHRRFYAAYARDRCIEVVYAEPEQQAVAASQLGIAEMRMLVRIPVMKLQDHVALGIDEHLVF